jgi:hypothetical protein
MYSKTRGWTLSVAACAALAPVYGLAFSALPSEEGTWQFGSGNAVTRKSRVPHSDTACPPLGHPGTPTRAERC